MLKSSLVLFFLFLIVSSCTKEIVELDELQLSESDIQVIPEGLSASAFQSISKTAATITFVVNSYPRYYTPLNNQIYVTGSFNKWKTGNSKYALTKQSNGDYTITFAAKPGKSFEFKFTRGNWSSVETTNNGGYLTNRSYTIPAQSGTEYFSVDNWEDMVGTHSANDQVYMLDEEFYIPQLNRYRRIWVYLPADYYTSGNQYPVLYMQDGQNLFDDYYSSFGEWEVDESMKWLQGNYIPGTIVVGIDNGEMSRIDEYSPWYNSNYGGGEGDLYGEFIVNTLKPYIDSNFNTYTGREHTGIMGSSMGGLISFYVGMKYQNVFSKIGALSPSFWFSNDVFNFVGSTGKKYDMKIYMVVGSNESSNMLNYASYMEQTLNNVGFSSSEYIYIISPGGEHSEWFWAQEFPEAIYWMNK